MMVKIDTSCIVSTNTNQVVKNILTISTLAKQRFETPPQYQRQTFTIGCHDSSELSLLSNTLEQMREKFPNFVPIFQVVPLRNGTAMIYGAYYKKEKSPMLNEYLDSFAAQYTN